jgi:CubicO group peptidase (beta-lactamase class C family)
MANITKKILAIFVVLAILPANVRCDIPEEVAISSAEKIDEIIASIFSETGIPGCVFVVASKDKILHVSTFGVARVGGSQKITKDMLIPISSLSKSVSAVLFGILVDEGKIRWDDKVRKYIPDFFISDEETSSKMTILDLISHRCGLKHFAADSLFAANYENPKILRALRYFKQRPGKYGKVYTYQNVVFGIIGDVFEKATGEKYEDLVEKYIFSKMGMKNSSALSRQNEENKFRYFLSRFAHDRNRIGFWNAVGSLFSSLFQKSSKKFVTNHSRYKDSVDPVSDVDILHKFPATSGISFSAEDLAKWIAILAGKGAFNGVRIISPESFEMITSHKADIVGLKDDDLTFVKSRYEREGMSYCSGFFSTTYSDNGRNKKKVLFHMGGAFGASSFFAVTDNISVAVACNLGGVSHTLFAEYIVNQFLDLCFGFSKIDWMEKELKRKKDIREKQDYFHRDAIEKNPTPMGRPEKYTGTYTSEIYGDVSVSLEGQELVLSNGINSTKLIHVNGNLFTFPCKNMFPHYHDSDEYIDFRGDSLYISCFSEEGTIFKRKKIK